MASAIDTVRRELADVEKQLDGYEDLVKQRDRLTQALKVLEGDYVAPVANSVPFQREPPEPARTTEARSTRRRSSMPALRMTDRSRRQISGTSLG